MSAISKRCWFTFPTRSQVEKPIIWQMSRRFPDVSFDIRQASVQNEIGIMAVLLSGAQADVTPPGPFLRSKGGQGDPIEKSVGEGGWECRLGSKPRARFPQAFDLRDAGPRLS